MITEIKNSECGIVVAVEDFGLQKGEYFAEGLTLFDLAREQKILFVKTLEWDDKTPNEIKIAHRGIEDQLANIIDSKCKENKP